MRNIGQIFEELNDSDIRYCHFKSNAHLYKSFEGKTDFDLLIHIDDINRFRQFIISLGFKKRNSTFNKTYIGMEDYLYYDSDEEKLHHFHIHYDLIFGAKYNKIFCYPNREILFNNISIHPNFPIKILDPEVELVFLILRIILKINYLSFSGLKRILLKKQQLPDNITSELAYLLSLCKTERLKKIVGENFKEFETILFYFLDHYKNNCITCAFILRSKLTLFHFIKKFQIVSNKQKIVNFILRKIHQFRSKSWLPNGGMIISIVGADGAGKTTMVKVLTKWLSYKISAKSVYFGRLKNDIFLKYLRLSAMTLNKIGFTNLYSLILDFSHVYVAYMRYKRYRNAIETSANGFIVFTDRYPLKEFWQMKEPMDGPRVRPVHKKLFSLERSLYNRINSPDILITLEITISKSIERKPKHKNSLIAENIERKIEAVNLLRTYLHNQNCYFVDATQEFSEVSKNIKKIIWNSI